jgi:non-specific serine/threonine protein kinase
MMQRPLIGRSSEITLARELLLDIGVPWLTLTGTGGVGKTHLALSLANLISEDYELAAFVPLAALDDPDLVLPSIAHSLGLAEPSERALVAYLDGFDAPKRLLLLIDNCEHVAPGFEVAGHLLTSSPGVQVVATSRAPLHLAEEHCLPLAPFDLPASGDSFEKIRRSESVQFFMTRARSSRPGIEISELNAGVIADICARLDGLPLAMELAAARLRMISPEALRHLLTDRLDVLVGGPRDAPERQRTLRNAINWSYDLLSDDEQQFLETVSVFAGGFMLDACSAVTGQDTMAVLERIAALVDHGLIAPVGSGEHPRFRLLATIREFALERLDLRGRTAKVRAAHARHYAELAMQVAPELTGPNQGIWARRLELDLNNFRAANAWLTQCDPSDPEAAKLRVRLANDLWRFWVTRGLLIEGRSWLEAAIHAPGFALVDLELQAQAHQQLGNMALDQGDLDTAQEHFEMNRAICDATGNEGGLASANNGLGLVAYYRGDHAEARHRHELALGIRRGLTDQVGLGNSLNNLGVTANAERSYDRAAEYIREGLTVRQANGDHGAVGYSLYALADTAFAQGRLDEARLLLNQCLDTFTQVGDQLGIAYVRSSLGYLAHDEHHDVEAAASFGEALGIRKALGDRRGCLESIEGIAAVLGALSHAALGVTLFAVAATIRQQFGLPNRPIDAERHARELKELRASLGRTSFAIAWTSGEVLPLDLAINRALSAAETVKQEQAEKRTSRATDAQDRPVPLRTASLTRRERDVLRLLTEGKANAEIAEELFIGQRTVETHVGNILTKLDVKSRSAAVAVAILERL